MSKKPRTTGEHIVALYGHIKGLSREIKIIKINHLKHMRSMARAMKKGATFQTAHTRAMRSVGK